MLVTVTYGILAELFFAGVFQFLQIRQYQYRCFRVCFVHLLTSEISALSAELSISLIYDSTFATSLDDRELPYVVIVVGTDRTQLPHSLLPF